MDTLGQNGPMCPVATDRSDLLDQADTAVLITARQLLRRWAMAMLAAIMITATGVLFLLWALSDPQMRWLAVGALWYPGAGAYLIHQLAPKERPDAKFVEPAEDELIWLADWVARQCGWRPRVRLTPWVDVWAQGDVLWIGMPLVAGLTEDELAVLIREAREQQQADSRTGVAFALSLAGGSLGRGLWGRKDARFGRWLMGGMHDRIALFGEARFAHSQARRAANPEWAALATRVEMVAEGWGHVVDQWLEPALEGGTWHADPFSGLTLFLDACELSGLLEPSDRMPGALPALRTVAAFGASEQEAAALLVSNTPHDVLATPWEQHPTKVTVAKWRVQLNDGLTAAGWVTGSPVPATFDGLVDAIKGRESTMAAVLNPTHAATLDAGMRQGAASNSPTQPHDATVMALILAAANLALIDSGRVRLSWEWPRGTVLRDQRGDLVLVGDVAEDVDGLRDWLVSCGVDPRAPLWLSEGRPPTPEQSQYAFNASVGRHRRRIVFTDRAVRVFARPDRPRHGLSRYVDGVLGSPDPAMVAVDKGQPEGLTSMRWDEVVAARLRPRIGGHWWGLELRTAEVRLKLRGDGNAREEELCLRHLLGERLHVRWSHERPIVRRVRDWTGYFCLGLGGLLLSLAAVGVVHPLDPTTTRLDWLAVGVAGLGILLVGHVPDIIVALIERRRHPRLRAAKSATPVIG